MAAEPDVPSPAPTPAPSLAERFKGLTAEERFSWWIGMLQLVHALATPEVREQWRREDHRRDPPA